MRVSWSPTGFVLFFTLVISSICMLSRVCQADAGSPGSERTFRVATSLTVGIPPVTEPDPARPVFGQWQWLRVPGLPVVPVYPVVLLLPAGTTEVESIEVSWSGCQDFSWRPGVEEASYVSFDTGRPLPLRLPSALMPVDGQNWPARPAWPHQITVEGDAVYLPLVLFPWSVKPAAGEATVCDLADVRVNVLGAISSKPALLRPNSQLLPMAVNPVQGLGYRMRDRQPEDHRLVILTRDGYRQDSLKLQEFVDFKKEQGFNPLVVTEEEIIEQLPDENLSRQKRIRIWLQNNYQEQGFEYLLIIGDPRLDNKRSVPMQVCYPAEGWDTTQVDVPTDMYYADLSGNWDFNDNGTECQLEDYIDPETGLKVGGVDLTAELSVGRIPHSGTFPNFGDEVLSRTMIYEKLVGQSWAHRVLLPSPMITFPDGNFVDGSMIAKYLLEKSLTPKSVTASVLGEFEGNLTSEGPVEAQLNMEAMFEYWNAGYGTVFWCSHGSELGAFRDIWWNDPNNDGLPQQSEVEEPAFALADSFFQGVGEDFPPVVFQASCLNANPDEGGNLTHSLIRRCSVGNVASTRITMGLSTGHEWQPSPFTPGAFTMGVFFVTALQVSDKSLGDAYMSAKTSVSLGVEPWTFKMKLEFNLYGDPTLKLPGCGTDTDCDDGSSCNGAETCVAGTCRTGQSLDCPQAEDQCHRAGCSPVEGCVINPKSDGEGCDDGDACTVNDSCKGGAWGGMPRICAALGPCSPASCDPFTGACVPTPLPEGTPCTESGLSGTCQSGFCLEALEEPDLAVGSDASVQTDASVSDTGFTEEVDASSDMKKGSGCGVSRVPSSSASVLWFLVVVLLLWRGFRRLA